MTASVFPRVFAAVVTSRISRHILVSIWQHRYTMNTSGLAAVATGVAVMLASCGADAPAATPPAQTAAATTTAPAAEVFAAAPTTVPASTTTTTAVTSTTTTTEATTTTTTTVATLPEQPAEPIAPPSDVRGFEPQIQLGGIAIPKLGVDAPLLEGIRLTTLDNGPGHWPGTAMPGEVGNVVVAAHRTSHGGPFRNIDQLVAGDSVVFTTDAGDTEYLVTSTQIVQPDAMWIVDPTDTPTATLFACHPPGSVRERIVVKLELAS